MANQQLERISGFVLIAVGILFYLFFGVLQGSFADVGVYAITIVPLALGGALVWRASGNTAGQ